MRPDRQVFEAGGRGTQLPVVDARAVVKSYGAGRAARRVLDGIDLEIAPGELVVDDPGVVALEHRDIDRDGRVAYVRRSFSEGRLTHPRTEASKRAVPLQSRALAALDELPLEPTGSPLLFPAERGGYLDLHNFRNRSWKPAPHDCFDPCDFLRHRRR